MAVIVARPSPLLFLASKVFCSFIVCTPTCVLLAAAAETLALALHGALAAGVVLAAVRAPQPAWNRAGLVREMPPRIAAGQRRSEHCRWLGGNRTKRRLPLAKVHVQAIELVAQNRRSVPRRSTGLAL